MIPQVEVRPFRISESIILHRSFLKALQSDFDYFGEEYIQKVISENKKHHLARAIVNSKRLIYGAFYRDKLIGYVIADIKDKSYGYIYWFFVTPSWRGKSIGYQLLGAILQIMKQKGVRRVGLMTHNQTDYYLRYGFSIDDIMKSNLHKVEMTTMSKVL